MKDYSEPTIVKSYLEGAKECGKTVTNSFVDSWYYLGQEFHTTGQMKVVKTEIDGRIIVMKFKAEVVDGFRFQDVYQPTTRQLLSFIADANERKLFVGKTVRPYVAGLIRKNETVLYK